MCLKRLVSLISVGMPFLLVARLLEKGKTRHIRLMGEPGISIRG